MKNWIVVDLDGTLCDCSHRVHLAQAKQWDDFNAGIMDDVPHPEVVTIIKVLNDSRLGANIVLCTGRDERNREATLKWLLDNELGSEFDELLMRPKDNRESDDVVKVQLIDEFFGSREKALESVLMVLDDRDRVVLAFRDAGFKCWQVSAGDY